MNVYDDIEKVKVLKWSYQLALDIYEVTKHYPRDEIYGLTSQIRRASVSVGSNVAEGKSRGSDKEYIRFLKIARGSLSELKFQLALSKDLGYLAAEDYERIMTNSLTIGGMLGNLINVIEKGL